MGMAVPVFLNSIDSPNSTKWLTVSILTLKFCPILYLIINYLPSKLSRLLSDLISQGQNSNAHLCLARLRDIVASVDITELLPTPCVKDTCINLKIFFCRYF